MGSGTRTVSIADDDRARIPFAMIGALILVSSVALVVSLELQNDAQVDVDDSLAMERTASAANTALFDATTQATHDAALEPVTEPADTDLGDVISDGGTYTGDDFFERYVKLRIYLEAQNNFAVSGQEFREMETEISIDPVEDVDDVDDAIESVTLTVGGDDIDGTLTEFDYGDHPDNDLGHGTLEVEIDDVEFTIERNGEVVAERTQPLSVTVGTPLFDLHHLTTEYEAQLNHDFADAQADDEYAGFDQYLASMLYPLAWERGYAQTDGEPIAEVVSNRHLETLANDALFQTQRAVFGNDDPHSDEVLTRAYACMLAQDANHVYDEPDGNSADIDTVLEHLDGENFCDELGYVYDDLDEEFDDPPDWTDLASQNDYLKETETIDLDDVSSTVYGELEAEDGIETVINRIYTVDVSTWAEIEREVNLGAEDGSNDRLLNYSIAVQNHERLIDVDETGVERDYHEFDIHFTGVFDRENTDTDAVVDYDVTLTISGEHSPDSTAADRGTDFDYKWGSPADAETIFDHNFVGVPDTATTEVLAGVENADDVANELERYFDAERDRIVSNDAILDGEDLVDELTGHQDSWTLNPEPADRADLSGWLATELGALEEETSELEIEPTRQELLTQDSPIAALESQLEPEDDWIYQHVDGEYDNVPDKVRAELYAEYMDRLLERIAEARAEHDAITAAFDTEVDDHMNTGTSEVLEFAADQFTHDPDDQTADHPVYPLLNGIEFVPEGAPAYLTLDRVDQEQVPVINDSDGEFAPLIAMNDDRYGIPFETAGSSAGSDGVQLRTAGEVLEAGTLADDLVVDSNWDDGDVAALESALAVWIDDYAASAGEYGAAPFSWVDEDDVAEEIEAEIDAIGPVERQAIAIGTGEATLDRIAANVSEEFNLPDESNPEYDYHLGRFRMHLEHAVRHGLDASLGDDGDGVIETGNVPALTNSLGETVRDELDDADEEVLAERLAQASASQLDDETLTTTEISWLDSDREQQELAPNRVSSGTPVVGIPKWNVLTANIWHVDLNGAYPRFTTRANAGVTATNQAMEYVREDDHVTLEIGDDELGAGYIESIAFESQLSVPIGVPADGLGIGDRAGDRIECSETYDVVGPIDDEPGFHACAGS